MTHFNNAVAAYQQVGKSTSRYECERFHEMAQNFIKWHINQVGGNYLDTYLAMVAEATGYYEKKAA